MAANPWGIAALGLLYRLFMLLPIRRNLAVFSSFPDTSDNSLAMFRHLREHAPQIEPVWIVSKNFHTDEAEFAGVKIVHRETLAAMFALAVAAHVFHTHGIVRFARKRRGQTIVNLWHGMPLKVIGTFDAGNRQLPLADLAIATSEFFKPVIARSFAMPLDQVLVTGQPRNDPMVREARRGVADRILWLPTYRHSISGDIRRDSPFGAAAMQEALVRLDAGLAGSGKRLILKLHPMDALNLDLVGSYDNIDVIRRDMPQEALPSLMARSQCLVTDYSSAAIDYAILGRPIGFYCPDRQDYARGFIPGVEDAFFAAGTMLDSVDALVRFILTPPAPQAPSTDLNLYCDDQASERLWNLLGQRETR